MTEQEKSEKLSIEEIVEHCNRICEKMELFAASKGKSQDEIADKTYWEHYQVKKYLKEIQQYRSIGTPDECRAAVEKQKAKKPKQIIFTKKDGKVGKCPCCGSIIGEDMIWCDDCGQKLDWSGKE